MSNDLHEKIMNLPCARTMSHFVTKSDLLHYKEGHREARHAAAELAIGYEAAPSVASGAPTGQVLPDEFWELVADCGGTKDLGKNARLLNEWVRAYGQACAAAEREAAAKLCTAICKNEIAFNLAAAIRNRK